MDPHAGISLDTFLREECDRDPEFAAVQEETRIEGDLALALARLREQSGLTQRALAQKSGIKQPMIARIERAAQTPTTTTLWRLLSALDAVAEIRPDGVTVRPAALQPVSLDKWRAAQAAQWDTRPVLRATTPVPVASLQGITATAAVPEDRLVDVEPGIAPQTDTSSEWEDLEDTSNLFGSLQEPAWAS